MIPTQLLQTPEDGEYCVEGQAVQVVAVTVPTQLLHTPEEGEYCEL